MRWEIITSLLNLKGIIIISLITLSLIIIIFLLYRMEKGLRKKLKTQNQENKIYKKRLKKLEKSNLNPKKFLNETNEIAKDFFHEAFNIPYSSEYSELVEEFSKKGQNECVMFCNLMIKLSYSGDEPRKEQLNLLISLLEKIIHKNKIKGSEDYIIYKESLADKNSQKTKKKSKITKRKNPIIKSFLKKLKKKHKNKKQKTIALAKTSEKMFRKKEKKKKSALIKIAGFFKPQDSKALLHKGKPQNIKSGSSKKDSPKLNPTLLSRFKNWGNHSKKKEIKPDSNTKPNNPKKEVKSGSKTRYDRIKEEITELDSEAEPILQKLGKSFNPKNWFKKLRSKSAELKSIKIKKENEKEIEKAKEKIKKENEVKINSAKALILRLKQENYSNKFIKKLFTKKGWPIDIINNLVKKINKPYSDNPQKESYSFYTHGKDL